MMEIADGVLCTPTLSESPWRLDYTIENTTAHAYEVELDFAGSSNVVVLHADSLNFGTTLRPYARAATAIAQVRPADRCAVCINYQVRRIEEETTVSPNDSHVEFALADDDLVATFFLDHTFPPTPACLGGFHDAPAMKCFLPSLTWTHVSSLYPLSTPTSDLPSTPASTLCGGDPAFVSPDMRCALHILGSRPAFVTILFPQGIPSHDDQRFVVALYHHGKPSRVDVDGFIPCVRKGGGPVLTKCTSGQLWPMLLHKALAKVYGGYSHLLQVSTLQLLEDLFGYPRIELSSRFVQGQANADAYLTHLLRQGHVVGVTYSEPSAGLYGLVLSAQATGLSIRSCPADSKPPLNTTKTVAHDDISKSLSAMWYIPYLSCRHQIVRRCFVQDATACASASAAMFACSVPTPCTLMVSATYDQDVHEAGISILSVAPTHQLAPLKATSKQGAGAKSCSVVVSVEAGEYIVALKPARSSASKDLQPSRFDRMFEMLDSDLDNRLGFQDMERFMAVYEDGLALSTPSFEWLLDQFDSDRVGLTRKGLEDFYIANAASLEGDSSVWDEPCIPCIVNLQCTSTMDRKHQRLCKWTTDDVAARFKTLEAKLKDIAMDSFGVRVDIYCD